MPLPALSGKSQITVTELNSNVTVPVPISKTVSVIDVEAVIVMSPSSSGPGVHSVSMGCPATRSKLGSVRSGRVTSTVGGTAIESVNEPMSLPPGHENVIV